MMKVDNFHFKNLVKITLIVLSILLIISSCTNKKSTSLTSEELTKINESYSEYFNSFNTEVSQLETREDVRNQVENRQVPELAEYSNIKIFDQQGNSLTGNGTIRDTIPYQRLMGHLDYYSYLENIDGQSFLSSTIKIYNFNESNPFRGILKVSRSLNDFFKVNPSESNYYLLDSNETLVKSDGTATVLSKENQNKLKDQIKLISSLEEGTGTVELDLDDGINEYNYSIKNGVAVFQKND